MSSRFDDETAVRPLGDGRFTATMSEAWWVHRGPNGGYLAAVVLRALSAAVGDPARSPRSLTVHYANPAGEGDVEITTSLDRVGRSMTTCSARIEQRGKLIALALRRVLRAAGGHRVLRPRHAPGPGTAPLRGPARPGRVAADRAPVGEPVGHRPSAGPGCAAWRVPSRAGGSGSPRGGRWTRSSPLRSPTPGSRRRSVGWRSRCSSRRWTSRSTSGPSCRIPDWAGTTSCSLSFRTTVAHGGFLEEDGEVWAPDGTLLAQSRQLATVLPLR